MKAAVLYEVNKPLVIEDVSLPKPGPREVLIRTSVAGLCHSDLHFMEGLYPHPLPAVLVTNPPAWSNRSVPMLPTSNPAIMW